MIKRCIVLGLLGLLAAESVYADRLHVRSDGSRTSGASTPGDWAPENCYPSLVAAAINAAMNDSLLLYRELHTVETVVTLPAHLGNQNRDGVTSGCELRLLGSGELVFGASVAAGEIAGIRLTGDGVSRTGSALYLDNAAGPPRTFTIRDCEFANFTGGRRPGGGAAIHAISGGGSTLYILGSTFENNVTKGKGGAVRIDEDYTALVEDCVFSSNTARSGSAVVPIGGAIAVVSPLTPSRLEIRRTAFTDNVSYQSGGALCVENASLVLEDCDVVGSRSAFDGASAWAAGAGLMMRRTAETHLEPVELIIRRCRFQDNVGNLAAGDSGGDGGGVLVRGIAGRYIDVTVEYSDFLENFNDQGAGLYIGRYATGVVSYCRFHRNTSYDNGGAAFKGGALPDNLGETAVFLFSEFVDNRAGYDQLGQVTPARSRGGAFATRERVRAEFYHCTFVDNVVGGTDAFGGDAIGLTAEGRAFDDDLERCQMVNCVFWGESGNDIQFRSDPLGLSRVENCAWASSQYDCEGVLPVALVPLTALPFSSVSDLAPFTESPLVDAGIDLGYSPDLRGQDVPTGIGPDIGAYECPFPSSVPGVPTPVLRLVAAPNPFNPRTILSCELPLEGPVMVDIMDLRGHRVRRLFAGHRSAGLQHWTWDGCDDGGRSLAAGVYLARVISAGRVAVRKVALVQ